VYAALLRPVGKTNTRTAVNARCHKLREGGHLNELWSATCQRLARDARPRVSEAEARRRRATALVHAAEPGAARRVLESTSKLGDLNVADVSQRGSHGEVVEAIEGSVVAEMLEKHPSPDATDASVPSLDELLREACVATGEDLTPEELHRQVVDMFDLHSFSKYVGRLGRRKMPACDMIRFEHVKAIAGAGYAQVVRDYVLLFALGDVPSEMKPYAYGGRLVAPSKPGNDGHRPLGAGTTWRRIAAGFLAQAHRNAFGDTLGPLQLGVGVSHGPAIFALAVRLALQAHDGWVAVKVDFRNAFNMCSRTAFLRFVAKHFPALILMLLAAYGAPTYITALGPEGWVRFLSKRGCTQGDPLGPLAHAAALHEALKAVQALFSDVLVVAIHDDVQIAGPPARVQQALTTLIQTARSVSGLQPTGHKFTLYAPLPVDLPATHGGDVARLEQAIESWTPREALERGKRCVAQQDGIVAAGVPIGSLGFQRDYALNTLEAHKRAHSELRYLCDTQAAYLLLRYSLNRRFSFLQRALGPVTLMLPRADGVCACDAHDAELTTSERYLLVDPTVAHERRVQLASNGSFVARIFLQAALPAKDGGLSLPTAELTCASAHLAGACAELPYVREHAAAFCLDGTALDHTSRLPYFFGLTSALQRLHTQSADAQTSFPDLAVLLAATTQKASEHALAAGCYAKQRELVLQMQPDDRHRARVQSAGGLHGGSWLCVFPITMHATARARHYQLALALRLGLELPELLPVNGVPVPCGSAKCGAEHDAFAFHPGACRAGNRHGLWTVRHDAFQLMLIHVVRLLGYAVQSCSVGAGNWFGAAGWDPVKGTYKRADVVLPHFLGPGRHMFLDTAITDPATQAALNAPRSSAAEAGVAATLRGDKKNAKYGPLAAGVSSAFRAAIIERFGTCGDSLVGFIKTLCGDGDRDALRSDDYTFSASSRTTYMASLLVFSAVISDAAMIDRVIGMDVYEAAAARTNGPRQGGRQYASPKQREVEGIGGRFWYELGQ
jgi:hypothetical protein